MQDKGRPKLKATAVAAPGWDRSCPAESFRAFAHHIHGMAKEVLLRDGHHSEMFFFLPQGGHGHLVTWRGGDRDLETEWLRKHISKHYIFGVVHIVEAWMHLAKKPGDHTIRQIQAGEIKVSELQPEDRQEALMVSAQARDGWSMSWVDEILRDAAGKLSLGPCREFADFQGRFGKLFG